MGQDALTLAVPGTVVVEIDLDDRGRWPGLRVTEWVRRGKGFTATVVAPPLVWQAVSTEIEGRLESKAGQNATRTALRRFATRLTQELGAR